jgi:hypothetical protein
LRIHVAIADDSAPWDLTIGEFRQRLLAYRQDARTWARSIPRRGEYLDFDLDFGGERRNGAYYPGQQLGLWDGPISDWAPVIVWFLGLLPEGAGAQCLLEAVPIPQPLPRTATAEDVTQILTELDARY